jgi:hypothetical protein
MGRAIMCAVLAGLALCYVAIAKEEKQVKL